MADTTQDPQDPQQTQDPQQAQQEWEQRQQDRAQERADALSKAREEATQGTRDHLGRKVGTVDELRDDRS